MGLFTDLGVTRVMGIVNVTPDSFSDGGLFVDAKAAITHGLELSDQGADILDIGGESTRPGATRPLLEEELERVVPVIRELSAAGAVVSVDTMRHEVAEVAVRAGAAMINDVSGGLADPDILRVAAATGVGYIAMHWRAHSTEMQRHAVYRDGVVHAVLSELGERVDDALAAGIDPGRLVLDPGLGFAKTPEHNWDLLRELDRLQQLGYPILVGSSRKSFLGVLLADAHGVPRPVEDREDANVALTTLAAHSGVWGVRVHDVRASVDAVRVVARLRSAGP
ncbi:Dihydropteroate synthase (DHPS) (Dihydropteroate pyrophosphorylase) [metagenome]|uniref:dihydropteroate synthase n=1 Tax=metagenome TaxID=256318 RepID=A0A2P2BXE6_9ZZZZ